MGNTLKAMFQTVDPLTFGCYYSVFEFGQIVQDYFSTVQDIDRLFYNIVHNMGKIYDNTVASIDLIRFGEPNNPNYWKNIGYYAGNSINQIFYKPRNYDPYRLNSKAWAYQG
jgi:hypothetical protein